MKTSAETKEFIGCTMAAFGLAFVVGGIAVSLFGNRQGIDLALAGTIATSAASVPLIAAKDQQDREHRAYVRSLQISIRNGNRSVRGVV